MFVRGVPVGTLWACSLPPVEQSKKLVLYLRAQVLRREAPAQSDDGPHLVDVLGAMRAAAQVGFEPMAVARRQSVFEVVRDKLDDLLAHERGATTEHGYQALANSASRASRIRLRPRCSRTRWFASVMSNRSQTSVLIVGPELWLPAA